MAVQEEKALATTCDTVSNMKYTLPGRSQFPKENNTAGEQERVLRPAAQTSGAFLTKSLLVLQQL